MKNGLDRRVGRSGVYHGSALQAHHIRVIQVLQLRHFQQGIHFDCRETSDFDSGQIPATAFHIEQ